MEACFAPEHLYEASAAKASQEHVKRFYRVQGSRFRGIMLRNNLMFRIDSLHCNPVRFTLPTRNLRPRNSAQTRVPAWLEGSYPSLLGIRGSLVY